MAGDRTADGQQKGPSKRDGPEDRSVLPASASAPLSDQAQNAPTREAVAMMGMVVAIGRLTHDRSVATSERVVKRVRSHAIANGQACE
jgi:hypothetical protein